MRSAWWCRPASIRSSARPARARTGATAMQDHAAGLAGARPVRPGHGRHLCRLVFADRGGRRRRRRRARHRDLCAARSKAACCGAAVMETIELSGTLFLVMMGAAIFNFFIETTQLPQVLVQSVNSSGLPRARHHHADHRLLRRARLLHGRAVHDPADRPFRLSGGQGAGLRSALVRHHHRDRSPRSG